MLPRSIPYLGNLINSFKRDECKDFCHFSMPRKNTPFKTVSKVNTPQASTPHDKW
ncbi:hypothetical protein NC651_029751 [Populus alba x Populus x berolinensis]|nr:hypothetical protein NC651_029751 [Populus alba x Populus x berolinensis]